MIGMVLCGVQAAIGIEVDGPQVVRFGLPIDPIVLERGLRLEGDRGAELEWSLLLEVPPTHGDLIWIEVVIVGHDGPGKLRIGGVSPSLPQQRRLCREVTVANAVAGAKVTGTRWEFVDGAILERSRLRLSVDAGEHLAGDVQSHESEGLPERTTRVRIAQDHWVRCGILPRQDGSGARLRASLLDALRHLPRAPGPRGRGDHLRRRQSEGADEATVTNNEFDTALAFVRLGLLSGDPLLLTKARECAWHLCDIDLDARSGLPCRHGRDHRSAPPETGHVWVHGSLLTALCFADRELLREVLGVATALAARVRAAERAQGSFDRLRDEAWPLLELEAVLHMVHLPPIATACDELASRIDARFDPALRTWRYGEGETRGHTIYKDRIWQTLGILVPALQAHAHRTGRFDPSDRAAALSKDYAALALDGGDRVPLSVMRAGDDLFGEVGAIDAAEITLLLDGLPAPLRARLVKRGPFRRAMDRMLDREASDLATRATIVGRSELVLR
ncbi:MAG: hypothetical protein AB7I19_01880 [Planctomycetota bacterium]